jgi:cupin 2 domain-containing protein
MSRHTGEYPAERTETVDLFNLFDDFPEDIDDEYVDDLVEGENVRVERIVSRGHASPAGFWYDQDEDEWVLLLSGAAGLSFQDEEDEVVLRPGDHVNIPAHKKHRVEWTSPDEETVWLTVFYRRTTGKDV